MRQVFIIGAQRSGSTYLYQILDGHFQVSMAKPIRPEPKFFLNEQWVNQGKEYYENKYFNSTQKETLYFGEKSTSYIESIEAASKIKMFYPDARILLILREPVSRAFSNYRLSVEHQIEGLSFKDALKAECMRSNNLNFSTSVNPFFYKGRGYYIDYIESYLKFFDTKQLKVLIFEEFINNLTNIQSLYRWLDIDDSVVPKSLMSIVNNSVARNKEPYDVFNNLAMEYQTSIKRLEDYLGRRINVWHKLQSNFSQIIS